MRVTSKVNKTNLKIMNVLMQRSLIKSVDALKTDVIQSQVMPFDTGNMQNDSMDKDDKNVKKGYVRLVVDTPYTRRLYFHPEYNFQTTKNPNARGLWFEPWINGNKKLFVNMAFARFLKGELEKYDSKRN